MNSKYTLDKINALKSKLAELKTPKLNKWIDMEKIQQLEEELKALRIVSIEKVGGAIYVKLDNSQSVVFHKFGNIIYSVISEGLDKKMFEEFKRDIEKFNWDVEKLKAMWI